MKRFSHFRALPTELRTVGSGWSVAVSRGICPHDGLHPQLLSWGAGNVHAPGAPPLLFAPGCGFCRFFCSRWRLCDFPLWHNTLWRCFHWHCDSAAGPWPSLPALRIYLPAAILSKDFASTYSALSWLCWVPNVLAVEAWCLRQGGGLDIALLSTLPGAAAAAATATSASLVESCESERG